MRVAALYDIHGNLPALEAVLSDVERVGVDQIIVGGDVMPGPMPAACLARLGSVRTPTTYITGNGERAVVRARDGRLDAHLPAPVQASIQWCADHLSPEQIDQIRAWPLTRELSVGALGPVLFCHATPRDDNEIFTERTPEAALLPIFDGVAPTVVCGHTHIGFDRQVGTTRIVNAGSVGMPFDTPGAHWLLLGETIEPRVVAYDATRAAARLQESEDPGASSFVDGNVLKTPDREQMVLMLERGSIAQGES